MQGELEQESLSAAALPSREASETAFLKGQQISRAITPGKLPGRGTGTSGRAADFRSDLLQLEKDGNFLRKG